MRELYIRLIYVGIEVNIGVTNMNIRGYNVMDYDIERCVCDAVKFRNKVGKDVFERCLLIGGRSSYK